MGVMPLIPSGVTDNRAGFPAETKSTAPVVSLREKTSWTRCRLSGSKPRQSNTATQPSAL